MNFISLSYFILKSKANTYYIYCRRDLLKSLRLQNKLESKLEKIERKTLKLKEKSLAVAARYFNIIHKYNIIMLIFFILKIRSSDSDAGRSCGTSKSRPIGIQLEEMEMRFDAKPAKNAVTVIPHMVGGETCMQQWEVCNIGDVRWDSDVSQFIVLKFLNKKFFFILFRPIYVSLGDMKPSFRFLKRFSAPN